MTGKILKIEVLGPGCDKCDDTYDKVKQVLEDLHIQAELTKIRDVFKIIDRGISLPPALIINGKILFQGKAPTIEKIKEIIVGQLSPQDTV